MLEFTWGVLAEDEEIRSTGRYFIGQFHYSLGVDLERLNWWENCGVKLIFFDERRGFVRYGLAEKFIQNAFGKE